MSLRRSRIVIATLMSSSLLAGLAVAETSVATTPATTLPATGEEPVGVIAIGHSGLTGENSDPSRPFEPALENSWATGTNPEVNSVYLRLVEVHPETVGHVANTAVGGALALTLARQAGMALEQVPTPELVIIQTIDNDLRCPLDENSLRAFGDYVTRALEQIVEASPLSRILMVGPLGRPDPADFEELVAAYPEVKPLLTGPGGECGGFFDTSGDLIEENVVLLTSRIEAYEAEQQRRCDAVPQCRTDGDVRAAYVDVLENLSPDLIHLNVLGQAAEADLIWPVVADVLGFDDGTDESGDQAPAATEPNETVDVTTATTPPNLSLPSHTIAPATPPVEIVGVYEAIEFYPACGNETLDHQGVTWHTLVQSGFDPIDPELQERIDEVLAVEREDSPVAGVHGLTRVPRVPRPGPGDDIGTLVVWADGVARWVSASGDLDVWMINDEIVYTWAC